MIKQLTIKKSIALEAVKHCSISQDLELIGIEPLKNYSHKLKLDIEAGAITNQVNFKDTFGYNNNFFYVLECVCDDIVDGYERGIGYIYEKEGKTLLKRVAPLYEGKNSAEIYPCSSVSGRTFCSNENVLLYSSMPTSYLEALAVEHCVITSSEPCLPQPIHLPQNSFLARFENNIEGVTFSDKRFVDKFVDILCSFSKQIKLAASKLSVKRAEIDILDLVPLNTDNVKAKIGSLCYDKANNNVRIYTKDGWKTLKFE